MLIPQLIAIIAIAFILLLVHRAGPARTCRAIGSFWFATADALDYGKDRYRGWVAASVERERRA
jgi:hypothetical protein